MTRGKREYSAFEIIDALGEEMDLMRRPQDKKWKAYFARWAYETAKADPKGYIYEQDGQEYVKVWDNHVIPFIIHMRIAGIDDALVKARGGSTMGCWREEDRTR